MEAIEKKNRDTHKNYKAPSLTVQISLQNREVGSGGFRFG